jgi:glycosyltransferase involved in cell wall biosynthesis
MSSISVVIPCYNGRKYLAEAIDSALHQTHANKEVIVVDDGSTDDSAEIMAGYHGRIQVVQQKNQGLPAARNAGIRVSKGDLIAFLDADDWWAPTFLEKTAHALSSNSAVMAYSGWQNIGAPPPFHEPHIPEDYEQALPSKAIRLFRSTGWPVHAALTRRDAIFTAGLFNTKLDSCEDFDLWLRIALNQPIVRVPEVLAYYRFHPGQMTRNEAKNALMHYQVQQDFLCNHGDQLKLAYPNIRALMTGELLKRGYRAYWSRNLTDARRIFRRVMLDRYGSLNDWKYMLPAWLPEALHQWLIRRVGK